MKHNKSTGNGGKVFVDCAYGHSVKMEFREKEMETLPDAPECRELSAESAAARSKGLGEAHTTGHG